MIKMNWLSYEDKIIALDKFNTILEPLMIYMVIVLLSTFIICFVNYMEFIANDIRKD